MYCVDRRIQPHYFRIEDAVAEKRLFSAPDMGRFGDKSRNADIVRSVGGSEAPGSFCFPPLDPFLELKIRLLSRKKCPSQKDAANNQRYESG